MSKVTPVHRNSPLLFTCVSLFGALLICVVAFMPLFGLFSLQPFSVRLGSPIFYLNQPVVLISITA